MMTAIAGVDIALWDIKGKAAGMPVYKLLGGVSKKVPCYVTGGYYQEGKGISELVQECETYVDMGYSAIKLKIGGVGVEEDAARIQAVREALGVGVDLMLDVNEGYDVDTAIRAAHLLEPLGIHGWRSRSTGMTTLKGWLRWPRPLPSPSPPGKARCTGGTPGT